MGGGITPNSHPGVANPAAGACIRAGGFVMRTKKLIVRMACVSVPRTI